MISMGGFLTVLTDVIQGFGSSVIALYILGPMIVLCLYGIVIRRL